MNNRKSIMVSLSDIVPDVDNPRQEFDPVELRRLESSIKANGILIPLSLEEQKDGKYLLIDGERRYRASKKLGLKEVPAVVLEAMSEVERLVKRFHLQEQHSSWTTWEKANAVKTLQQETGMGSGEIAESLGLTNGVIEKYVMVSALSKRTANKLIDRKLPFEWIVEFGRMDKAMKEDEGIRDDVKDALIEKIDKKIIIKAKDLRRYRGAIMAGGKKIIDKIIKDKKYSPSQALIDSGMSFTELRYAIGIGCSHISNDGLKVLAQKNFLFTEVNHKMLLKAKNILDKLVDVDWE